MRAEGRLFGIRGMGLLLRPPFLALAVLVDRSPRTLVSLRNGGEFLIPSWPVSLWWRVLMVWEWDTRRGFEDVFNLYLWDQFLEEKLKFLILIQPPQRWKIIF